MEERFYYYCYYYGYYYYYYTTTATVAATTTNATIIKPAREPHHVLGVGRLPEGIKRQSLCGLQFRQEVNWVWGTSRSNRAVSGGARGG